jgi:hypothetical protein
VIPQFAAGGISYDFVPNFNPAMLLHGEQYLKICGPIPTSGTVINQARLLEVLDKVSRSFDAGLTLSTTDTFAAWSYRARPRL